MIAANVPRRAAAAVAMANKVSPNVVGEDSIYLPKNLPPQIKGILQTLRANHGKMPHSAPMKGMNVEDFTRHRS